MSYIFISICNYTLISTFKSVRPGLRARDLHGGHPGPPSLALSLHPVSINSDTNLITNYNINIYMIIVILISILILILVLMQYTIIITNFHH